MIDLTKQTTLTTPGCSLVTIKEHQVFAYGKVLLVRHDHCVVMVTAGDKAKTKVRMPLTYPVVVDGVQYAADVSDEHVAKAPAMDVARKPKRVTGETKLDRCRAIFSENRGLDKAAIVKKFIDEAACTPAGANTYYLSIKKQMAG